MGLFGDFSFKEDIKPKLSIYKIAEIYFSDEEELLKELSIYLASRKEQRNMPSKIAWENQMKLLEKVPEDKRVNQVKNAILKGWRSVAFVTPFNDKTTTSNVTRKHTDKSTVCSTGF